MNRCAIRHPDPAVNTRCTLEHGHPGNHNGWVHFASGACVTAWPPTAPTITPQASQQQAGA